MWGLDIQAGGIEIQVHVPPSPLPFGSVWLAAGRQKPFGFVRYYFLRFLSDTWQFCQVRWDWNCANNTSLFNNV